MSLNLFQEGTSWYGDRGATPISKDDSRANPVVPPHTFDVNTPGYIYETVIYLHNDDISKYYDYILVGVIGQDSQKTDDLVDVAVMSIGETTDHQAIIGGVATPIDYHSSAGYPSSAGIQTISGQWKDKYELITENDDIRVRVSYGFDEVSRTDWDVNKKSAILLSNIGNHDIGDAAFFPIRMQIIRKNGNSIFSDNSYSIFVGYVETGIVTQIPDAILPVIKEFDIPSEASTLTIPIVKFSAVDNDAVAGWHISENIMPPLPDSEGWAATPQKVYTFSTQGTKTLYAYVRDNTGNVSLSRYDTCTISNVVQDVIKPTILSFTLQTSTELSKPVVGEPWPITSFVAADNSGGTGIGGYFLQEETYPIPEINSGAWLADPPTEFSFSTSGDQVLYAWVKDNAGNISNMVGDSTLEG